MTGRVTAALLVCLSFGGALLVQSSDGSIGGIVQDPSGALIPGVTITITNTGTGVTNTAVSNETGAYTLGRNVLEVPGTYRFDASISKSFRIDESKSLQIRVDATNVLNHADPGNPTLTLGDSFGDIASKGGQVRNFQGQLRLSF